MRNLILILFFGLIGSICYSQVEMKITEKRNIYNEKGDYYYDRDEYKKAIVFYNMAYEKDANDYFSVLKKAEAYEKMEMYPQAEECYRVVFESNRRPDNIYRFKYAHILLANNKFEEFKLWLNRYSEAIETELQSKNVLVSREDRIKLYRDSTIVIVTDAGEPKGKDLEHLESYKSKMNLDVPKISIEGFGHAIENPVTDSQDTVVYFTSDAPGGKGGKDIYRSRKVDNQWAAPENLGDAVNASSDEMYPFLVNDTILYFTSNRHGGFGGLDVYKVNLKEPGKQAINMGVQINSSSDDYNLFLMPDGKTGFFTSNRPGGSEKTNIYRADIFNFKMKYEAYRYRRRSSDKDDMINFIVSNGDEYFIEATNKGDYEFGFRPAENYKIVIQKENIEAENILKKTDLPAVERTQKFLNPPPLQKAEIVVPYGMKYEFSAGGSGISSEYKIKLAEKKQNYQAPDNNVINLTAIAKELEFEEGEVYTIRFIKDESKLDVYKGKEVSTLYINEKVISLYGNESFYAIFPLKTEANFNIQTNLDELESKYNPKKYSLVIDDAPVFAEAEAGSEHVLALTVNTESEHEVIPINRLTANEISIVPGTEYLLTLSKPNPATGEDIEIIVPLTRGVKYNLNSLAEDNTIFKEKLAGIIIGRQGLELADEEVIDISILSKALEVQPGEDISFHLLPVKRFGRQPVTPEETKSLLTLDDVVYEITRDEKYTINIPFDAAQKVSIQTDLEFVQQNFKPEDYILRLDTTDFLSEIVVDTTGYAALKSSGWLVSMSVNTDVVEEVEKQNQFVAREVSIIPGKEYILTVSKIDAKTGKKEEIIIPLIRKVKYDFTTKPDAEEAYMESLEEFVAGHQELETVDGTLIDITLISKELQINEGDEVTFSLLPVKPPAGTPVEAATRSNLYLDNMVVEFTQFQKYTINVPPNEERQMNMQTNIEHLAENFEPGSFSLDIDTIEFFSEIVVDTTGWGNRARAEEEIIKDPVFDVVVVNFNLNEYALRPEAKNIIREKVIDELKADSRLYVTIKGYTDALGDAEYNLQLSKKRAESVKEFLSINGIGDNRIRTFSFGAAQLLEENVNWKALDESELRKYRKVEIVIYLPE